VIEDKKMDIWHIIDFGGDTKDAQPCVSIIFNNGLLFSLWHNLKHQTMPLRLGMK